MITHSTDVVKVNLRSGIDAESGITGTPVIGQIGGGIIWRFAVDIATQSLFFFGRENNAIMEVSLNNDTRRIQNTTVCLLLLCLPFVISTLSRSFP